MCQVAAKLVIPVCADTKGKCAGELADDFLAAFGDASEDCDGGRNWDEPKQPLFVAQFLQVKAGWCCQKNVCPRQKKTHTQTKGAKIDQLCSAQTDGVIIRRGGGGFRFRGNGDFVGHND